jgi:hypothetical protein
MGKLPGYCIKCKAKTEIKEGQIIYYKNGAPAEKGLCSVCNAPMSRILTKAEREELKAQTRQE